MLTTFSLLPTASLLCALENDGYAKLDLLAIGESVVGRLSNSGTGIDDLRALGAGDVLVDLRSGGVEALSPLWDDRLDLCLVSRGFFDFGVSESLSLSLSLTFEGMVRGVERWDGVEGWAQQAQRWGEIGSGLRKI